MDIIGLLPIERHEGCLIAPFTWGRPADRQGDVGMTTAARRNYDSVDVAKFVLSILVVAIHVRPFDGYAVFFRPILRTAVPPFFLISSYFFSSITIRIYLTLKNECCISKSMFLGTFVFICFGCWPS